jgi:lysozyme
MSGFFDPDKIMDKVGGWFSDDDKSTAISGEVSSNSSPKVEDVQTVKSVLSKTGYYKPNTDIGEDKNKLSQYPDNNLFNSVKKYQKDTGSYKDGVFIIHDDGDNNDTIAYGHKLTPEEKKSEKYKNGISEQQAEDLLKNDILEAQRKMNKIITNKNLTKEQKDSLVSLFYNIKEDSLKDSKTVDMINKGEKHNGKKSLEQEYKEFRKAGDKVKKGLVDRRDKEWKDGNWDKF